MNHHQSFSATKNEPVPSLRLSGVEGDIPILMLGDHYTGEAIHLGSIPDLPTWLREFATRLTEFAELVEVPRDGGGVVSGDVQVLRQAATRIRHDVEFQQAHGDPTFLLAVADWLHTAGADIWAHGPLCECTTGCDACDDNLWEPHARDALTVARAYLAEVTA